MNPSSGVLHKNLIAKEVYDAVLKDFRPKYINNRGIRYRRPNLAEFAEIAEKTYAISQFLAEILPVPISPSFEYRRISF